MRVRNLKRIAKIACHSCGSVADAFLNPTNTLCCRICPRAAIRRRLSLHVLTDYDGARLRSLPPGGSAVASTLFLASRPGAGGNGMVEIVMPGLGLGDEGRARFLPMGSGPGFWQAAFYARSVYEAPGDMAVLQVSAVMSAGGPRKATD
nr:fasciclin-like arabinogalactan protein 1 [Aegilops tauschii subsp. strangulata]